MPSFPLPRPCLWLRLSLATALFAGLLAGTAGAQVQDKAQQGCITGLGKAAAKVLKSQALDVYACVGLGALGRELDPATCLAEDRKGKVAKAESKTQLTFDKKCPSPPDFGTAAPGDINDAAKNAPVELLGDVFGDDVNAAVLTGDLTVAKCQRAVLKAYDKVLQTEMKAWGLCQRAVLKEEAASDAAGFASQCLAFVETDARGLVAKMRSKLEDTLVRKCGGVDLAAAFPGACAAEMGAPAVGACMTNRIDCRMCRMVTAAGGLPADCDLFDDGLANLSCPACGNGATEGSEICDTTDLDGQACTDFGFAGGTLACASDCGSFVTTGCLSEVCGNDAVEGSEICDGTDVGGASCASLGLDGGTLGCAPDCGALDTANCGAPVCDDGILAPGEVCDGALLGGATCSSIGYGSGTLACEAGCAAFDTSGCSGPVCGDAIAAGSEVCDGADVRGETCQTQGFGPGTLACDSNCDGLDTSGCAPPPDPATIAPSLDNTVPTKMGDANRFLYEGENAPQKGVAPGTIDDTRVAVLRGSVRERDGGPLGGVRVTVLDHPDLGWTITRADGIFDLAVNGGGRFRLTFEKEGYLSSQRAVDTRSRTYQGVQDVALVPLDPTTTIIELNSSIPIQVATGSTVNDSRGERTPRVFFRAGTTATLVFDDGSTQPLDIPNITVRFTEYTAGPDGPSAMPGELPPATAYNFAAEYSVDEAVAAGTKTVFFNPPVVNYLDNFNPLSPGMVVPIGFYDPTVAEWVADVDGRVVEILSVVDGKAELDVEGSGVPASAAELAALGISDEERTALANIYPVGKRLQRNPMDHFSTPDLNHPIVYEPGAEAPAEGAGPVDSNAGDDCRAEGSVLELQSQVLGEVIPVRGTPYRLHYRSDRVPGRRAAFSVRIPLWEDETQPRKVMLVRAAGNTASRDDRRCSNPNTVCENGWSGAPWRLDPHLATRNLFGRKFVEWDGVDAFGRELQGRTLALVSSSRVWNCGSIASQPPGGAVVGESSFGSPAPSNLIDWLLLCGPSWLNSCLGCPTCAWQPSCALPRIDYVPIGVFDPRPVGLGGWTVDVHHSLSVETGELFRGDGGVEVLEGRIRTLGVIDEAQPSWVIALARAPDGGTLATYASERVVRHIAPDGTVSIFAGGGNQPAGTEGVPATDVDLCNPTGLATAPDGSVFVAETGCYRVRRITPDGLIYTFAGTGSYGLTGDGGPATAAELQSPFGLAFGPDGSLFIANRNQVRRVDPAGIISRYAGTGAFSFGGDGGFATVASFAGIGQINGANNIAADSQGNLFVLDHDAYRVRRITPAGIIETVAGNGTATISGDGGAALDAGLGTMAAIAVGGDGYVYVADNGSSDPQIRRFVPGGDIRAIAGAYRTGELTPRSAGPAMQTYLGRIWAMTTDPEGEPVFYSEGDYQLPWRTFKGIYRVAFPRGSRLPDGSVVVGSRDGNEVFVFDEDGRHLETRDTRTGALLREFGYDSEGRLETVIERQADGAGLQTTFLRDSAGQPMALVGPFGQTTMLAADAQGYLTDMTHPSGTSHTFSYGTGDQEGLMLTMQSPGGASYSFSYDSLGRLVADTGPVANTKTLARTGWGEDWTVSFDDASARTTSYQTQIVKDGGISRVVAFPDGTSNVLGASDDASYAISLANRLLIQRTLAPSPRFGIKQPYVAGETFSTPGGRTRTTTRSRTVTLADPADPFSLQSRVDTTEVNGRVFTQTYDDATRTTTLTTPVGRVASTVQDERGRLSQLDLPGLHVMDLSYDSAGRTSQLAWNGRTTSFTYDSLGRPDLLQDALGRSFDFDFDADERPVRITNPALDFVDLTWTADGNLASLTPPGGAIHSFTWDAAGRMTRYQPPAVDLLDPGTDYTWDAAGRLLQTDLPGISGESVIRTYDANGRPATIAVPGRTVTLTHQASNHPTPGALDSVVGGGVTLDFGWDAQLLASVSYSGAVNGAVSWTWDNDFRIVSETVATTPAVNYAYDDDGLATTVGALAVTRHAASGRIDQTTLANVTQIQGWNDFGERTAFAATWSSSPLLDIAYAYDALGRITQRTESVLGAPAVVTDYAYDAAGHLDTVHEDSVLVADYDYDANGNRTAYAGSGGPAVGTYDVQDRLLSYDGTTYVWNLAGDLVSSSGSGGNRTYDYDALGNLLTVDLPMGDHVDYVVDGFGRRVGRSWNDTPDRFWLYRDALNPVAELDAAGLVQARFVYGTHPFSPDYMEKGGVTYAMVRDHLGSIRLVVDTATGAVAQRIDYDAFGRVLTDTNPGFQPFGFAGGLYDPDTDLVRFGARDYDPRTGRWLTRDPILFDGGTNLYAYSFADPVNFIDPNGRHPLLVPFVLGMVGNMINGALNNPLTPGDYGWMTDVERLGWQGLTGGLNGMFGEFAGWTGYFTGVGEGLWWNGQMNGPDNNKLSAADVIDPALPLPLVGLGTGLSKFCSDVADHVGGDGPEVGGGS